MEDTIWISHGIHYMDLLCSHGKHYMYVMADSMYNMLDNMYDMADRSSYGYGTLY